MLKTIEWNGIPIITGSLTEFLLSVEDHLDDEIPLFVRLGGVWDILPRLVARMPGKHEDVLVLNDGLTAGCLALRTNGKVISTSRVELIQALLFMASEIRSHVLIITDRPTAYHNAATTDAFAPASKLTILKPSGLGTNKLIDWIVKSNTGIIIYDAAVEDAYQNYEELLSTSTRNVLWIQMPRHNGFHNHPADRPRKKKNTINIAWKLIKAKVLVFKCAFTGELHFR